MRKRTKSRRTKSRSTRSKRQRGGSLGQSYTLGAPLIPGVDTGISFAPTSSCMAAVRPGTLPAMEGTGLPGMGGGGNGNMRNSKNSNWVGGRRGRSRRSQRGGRYTADLSPLTGAAPWAGGIPGVIKIPCEDSATTHNPLNTGTMVQNGGVGGIDSARYLAPTAGYSNVPSTWVGNTGSPYMLQTPYAAGAMNPACLTTAGGGRRSKRSKRTKRSKRSKRSKSKSRKSRC